MKTVITNVLLTVYYLLTVLLGLFFAVFITANKVEGITRKEILRVAESGLEIRDWVEEQLEYGNSSADITLDMYRLTDGTSEVLDLWLCDEFGSVLNNAGQLSLDLRKQVHIALTRRDFQGQSYHFIMNSKKKEIILFLPYSKNDKDQIVVLRMFMVKLDRELDRLTVRTALLLGFVFLCHGCLLLYFRPKILNFAQKNKTAVSILRMDPLGMQNDYNRKEDANLKADVIAELKEIRKKMRNSGGLDNPLTGLPGNNRTESWIRALLNSDLPFCVLYADLDNLKAFNGNYGFSKGDDLICFTGNILRNAFDEYSDEMSFLGHHGGDDFIGSCSGSNWKNVCEKAIKDFEAGIKKFYSADDLNRDDTSVTGRQNKPADFSFCALSIAVVINRRGDVNNFAELADLAIDVMKIAKKESFSSYAVNRRSEN